MVEKAYRITVADEQFAFFIDAVETHAGRRTRLRAEAVRVPARVQRERDFEEETERLLGFLHGQEVSACS